MMKYLSFGLTFLTVLTLMVATVLEKFFGSTFVSDWIYTAPWFVVLWALVAGSSLCYLLQRHVSKRLPTFLLHLSFLVILEGGLVTYLSGLRGSVHLRQGEAPVSSFTASDGRTHQLPFSLSLEEFHLEYYPGTLAPMDFVSEIAIDDNGQARNSRISMNNICSYRHYRFYQSRYDSDGRGTTLSVSHDPYGIAISYTGYVLLLVSILSFFFQRDSQLRVLLRHPALRKSAVSCLLLFATGLPVMAADSPQALPAASAKELGKLYVYYNDRICPLQTLAQDFTVKLYGKKSYEGLSAEQVLSGWMFYYDSWKDQPIIRIKSKNVRSLLGIDSKYACLRDFIGPEGYKLEKALRLAESLQEKRAIEEANEKFNLISMVCTGSMLKLFPYRNDSLQTLQWYSPADRLPLDMPANQALFIHKSISFMGEQVAMSRQEELVQTIHKLRHFQQSGVGQDLPSDARIQAERLYNAGNKNLPIAIVCILIGFASFIYYGRRMMRGLPEHKILGAVLQGLAIAQGLYLLFLLALRGYISGHLPMSNGFETMQCIAVCALVLSLLLHRRMPSSLAFGFLLCGMALMVARFGETNPVITQLVPVLSSPLLSLHVMVIMIAYALLGFMMLNGIMAVVLHASARDCRQEIERLQVISRILLYPAVFCLAIGIFIGAVWANVSWGRYWGWDPKEVWALITMLIYASALHPTSLKAFRRPMFFHIFSILAFLSVLITYFGVNFILGGMHSYA